MSGLASHFCLTQAFRFGDATVVVPLDFMRIPLIALVGWWFYGEALDAYVFAGAALIVLGISWNLRAEAILGGKAAKRRSRGRSSVALIGRDRVGIRRYGLSTVRERTFFVFNALRQSPRRRRKPKSRGSGQQHLIWSPFPGLRGPGTSSIGP